MGTIQASPRNEEEADDLRIAYNSAFWNWVTEVRSLQAFTADPSAPVEHVKQAKCRTQEAEKVYRERRNLLLRRMSARRAGG